MEIPKEYFVIMKPGANNKIVYNDKNYGYDKVETSEFTGKLIKKEYTTYSQNAQFTFETLSDKIYHVHHTFLEQNTAQLQIGETYQILCLDSSKPNYIKIMKYHRDWHTFIPFDMELTGISKTNGKYMVYRKNQHKVKSYGEFERVENAIFFRDYCKKRGWNKKLNTNRSIGKSRAKSLKTIFETNVKKDYTKKLDLFFGINDQHHEIQKKLCSEKPQAIHQYKFKPKTEKMEYNCKLRIMNKKYNSLGVTIPKKIITLLNLKEGDTMHFNTKRSNTDELMIDIYFEGDNFENT